MRYSTPGFVPGTGHLTIPGTQLVLLANSKEGKSPEVLFSANEVIKLAAQNLYENWKSRFQQNNRSKLLQPRRRVM